MKWWQRLSVKIPLFALILALGPLGIFGVTSVREAKQGLLKNVENSSRQIAEHAADMAETSIQNSIVKIQIGLEAVELDMGDPADQEWALQILAKELPEVYTFAVIDIDGRETAKSDRERVYLGDELKNRAGEQAVVEALQNRVHIGQVKTSSVGTQRLPVALPIIDPVTRKATGVLAVEISIRKLTERIGLIGFGDSGIVYVLNMDGRVIAHPDNSRVLAGQNLSSNKHFQHVQEGHAEELGALHTMRDENGKEILTSGRISRELGWVFMTEQPSKEALALIGDMNRRMGTLLATVFFVVVLAIFYFSVRLTRPLRRLEAAAGSIAEGNLGQRVAISGNDEMGAVASAFNTMSENLSLASENKQREEWLKAGQAELEDLVRGVQSMNDLCRRIVTFCAKYVNARIGALYVREDEEMLRLKSSYAYTFRKNVSNEFHFGEGLVGQAALEKQPIVLTDCPDDYIVVASGLGESKPKTILVMPLIHNEEVVGVMEVAAFGDFSEIQRAFLQQIGHVVAVTLHSSMARKQIKEALVVTQKQAEGLKVQQEELRVANEELEEHTERLQRSEEKLKNQQEKLRASNEELEEKSQELEEQKENLEQKNRQLEQIRQELEEKAREMKLANRYKSEFLANMSHELRTPLNSLLLLARDLSENKGENLDADQVESAQIIYNSGTDLLDLINEILDLSKIEAGMMTLRVAETSIEDIRQSLQGKFKPLADQKGLAFSIDIETGFPETIATDRQRLEQVVRNLLGNAIKFTDSGKVAIVFHRPKDGFRPERDDLVPAECVAISVVDEGIGIPENKRREIFEAFKQVDSGSTRAYSGTGLGLSISRELAKLLGGEIQLESEVGKGSTFTVLIPVKAALADKPGVAEPVPSPHAKPTSVSDRSQTDRPAKGTRIEDDRDRIDPDKRTILIVEDDARFARTLYRLCRERGFNCLHAGDGESGMETAKTDRPDAIILDIKLPGMSGWQVLETLKRDTELRHIPVHFMSVEDENLEAFRKGAVGFLSKPVTREGLEKAFRKIEGILERGTKKLLIVEDDPVVQKHIKELIGNGDVISKAVSRGEDAIEELSSTAYDCVILDLKLPDIGGFEVLERLEKLKGYSRPPVLIYTGKDLTKEEDFRLQQYGASVIVKGIRSEERLLDEASIFLHRVVENLPDSKKKMIAKLYEGDTLFDGKTILLADDDMRNVFALSKVLENKGMRVLKAPDGKRAIEVLGDNPQVDLVLMDIMMPVMDGYEAIRKIREQERFDQVPIIAITAKAMKDDREKALQTGANDYFTKPVEIDRLLSLMRVWLHK